MLKYMLQKAAKAGREGTVQLITAELAARALLDEDPARDKWV